MGHLVILLLVQMLPLLKMCLDFILVFSLEVCLLLSLQMEDRGEDLHNEISLFDQQIFIDHLVSVRHTARHQKNSSE